MTTTVVGGLMAYRVDSAGVIRERLRQLYTEADGQGRGDAFAQALRSLHTRLATNPFIVGEMTYRLPSGAPVHHEATGPLSVNFVIYEAIQAVCITKVNLLSAPGK